MTTPAASIRQPDEAPTPATTNEAVDPADPLAAGDAVAAKALEALAPHRFAEAADDDERRAGYQLRFDAVIERDLASVSLFPDRLECDEFDRRSTHIIGWHGDEAIATCRVVFPAPGEPLPVEQAFGITIPGAETMVDWGRVVVAPAHRGNDTTVFMGLAARAWLSMRARGFKTAVGATPPRLVELFVDLGFAVTILGPPQIHWGELRHPILCDGPTTVPGLAQQWNDNDTAKANTRARAK